MDPLLASAMKKAGVVWLRVPGQSRDTGVWLVWQNTPEKAAGYVLHGPGEQTVPGLAETQACSVIVRSSGTRARILEWRATVERVAPNTPEWNELLPTLVTKRLNLSDSANAPARWAKNCVLSRLTPIPAAP